MIGMQTIPAAISAGSDWKATLDDPQALKRFRQFVNSPDADENIVFVEERSQMRPAPAE